MQKNTIATNMNALLILILSGIILGAFYIQLVLHEEPCPLCWLQRVGMIGVATGAFFNIWFGIHPSHYGFSLLSCLVGGSVALRQITLHVCPGFPVAGPGVLGLSLYTWSFFTFASAILYIAILLFLYNPIERHERKMNALSWSALTLLLLVIVGNIVTSYLQCGLGPCQD